MQKLIEILEEIRPDIDFSTCENLIDGGHFDSLSIISLVAELEEAFDIMIPVVEIVSDNFNSAERIWEMVLRLKEGE